MPAFLIGRLFILHQLYNLPHRLLRRTLVLHPFKRLITILIIPVKVTGPLLS
jgi:hypothetical protein